MRHRAFIAALSALLVLLPAAAPAQAPKPARIGLLVVSERTDPVASFRAGLRERGYVEGRDVIIDYRSARGQTKRLPALVTELVNAGAHVIVTHSTAGIRAAKKVTSTVPIVMASVGNAVESGLVASFAKPGGNVTGNSFFGAEMSEKRLEVLKEVLPAAPRMALLAHPSAPEATKERGVSAARTLGLQARLYLAAGPAEFGPVFAAMKRDGAAAVDVLGSPIFFTNRRALIAEAARHGLPVIYPWRDAPEEGGLMSLGPDPDRLWQRAASFVDRILKGAKPADIPVERATDFELVINLKTARALGLRIPSALLLRAKDVIE